MSKGKIIALCIITILIVYVIWIFTIPEEQAERQSKWDKENLTEKEPKFDQPLQLSREWQDADTLRELRKVGQITPEEECRVILNLIRDSRNDAYLFEFWNQFLEEECR